MKKLFWAPVINAAEIERKLIESDRNRKRAELAVDAIINKIIKKSTAKLDAIGIPKTVYGKKGIAITEQIQLDERQLYDKKTDTILKLGDFKEIHPNTSDFQDIFNAYLSRELKRVAKHHSRREFYFQEQTIFTFNEITFKLYMGFRFQTIQNSAGNGIYLMVTNTYKPLLLPTMDRLLTLPDFQSFTTQQELAGIPLNTLGEYSIQFNKPGFAGYLQRIIRHDDPEYRKLFQETLRYYDNEGEQISRYIRKKINESQNQPIIEVTQRKQTLHYLSSLLIMTPSSYTVSEILSLITGDEEIKRKILRGYYEKVTPYPSEYMALENKWKEIIKKAISESKMFTIPKNFEFIYMEEEHV